MGNGFCEYCGQGFETEYEGELANYQAKHLCNCDGAYAWKKRKEQIQRACETLGEIFAYSFSENGIRTVDEENGILDILKRTIPYMVSGEVGSVVIKIGSIGKITLSCDSEGKIKIKKQVGNSIEKKV